MSHDHRQDSPSDPALQVKALESLLVEKGFVDPAALDALVDAYENKIGPHIGARVVAHAWNDLGFKERLLAAFVAVALLSVAPLGARTVVESGATMTYLANQADPGIGMSWTAPAFDDGAWSIGSYGVGFETGSGAEALLQTLVPAGTYSAYTRATFTVDDVADVASVTFGVDYDDGVVAWLNGIEIYRSPSMDGLALDWDTDCSKRPSTAVTTGAISKRPSVRIAPVTPRSASRLDTYERRSSLVGAASRSSGVK